MSPVPPSILTEYGPFVVLAFLLVEGTVSFVRRDRAFGLQDTAANITTTVVGNILSRFLWVGLAYAAYSWAYQYAPYKFAMDTWWAWALLVLASDLAWYWEHRANHKMRLLWAVHSVHHSSEKFNYSVALRLPWLGGLTRIPFLMPLAFLGFSPAAVAMGFSVVFLYQIWVHTEYVGKIGWLEEILSTPSHHRVHHATNTPYLDKNYGGMLIIWDRLFGTFQREGEQASYGILHPIASHNPVVINSRDMIAAVKALRTARSVPEFCKIGFGDPAWPVPSAAEPRAGSAATVSSPR